jgi:hypothetical protein
MFNKKVTSIVSTVVAGVSLILYLSMHSVLGFIGYTINFSPITYILGVILAGLLIVSLIETLYKHNKKSLIALSIVNTIFFALVLFYFIIMKEHILVFLLEIAKYVGVSIVIAIIVYLIFYFPKSKFYKKSVAIVICCILVIATIISYTNIKDFIKINFFTNGAVVYAVETDYQIVWTTYSKSMAWVEIDGVEYKDVSAGSLLSTQTVHKVSVPQSALDEAMSYTIFSKAVVNEEGFSAWVGRTISKTYTFRPVNEEDGLQYYTFADSHGNNSKAINASEYYGADTDFIIMDGDTVSFLETTADLERIISLGNSITNGNIPIVYARGNHELKSEQAENLYRYVGCNEDNSYYYSFRLGSVWGVVLDSGEDHDDDWYEFYGTADFDEYRQDQLVMLDNIIEDSDNTYNSEDVKYKIAVCHIPTSFVSYDRTYMYEYLIDLNTRLNQIDIDVMLNGHIHEVFVVDEGYGIGEELYLSTEYTKEETISSTPEYIATGAEYPSIIVSRRSDTQDITIGEKTLGEKFIGTALEYTTTDGITTLTAKFTTNKKKVLSTINPFTGDSNEKTIYIKTFD